MTDDARDDDFGDDGGFDGDEFDDEGFVGDGEASAEEAIRVTAATLAASREALEAAIGLFRDLAGAKWSDLSDDGDAEEFVAATRRLTALHAILVKEKKRYDAEHRSDDGAPGGDIDFDEVRRDIGRALDRLRDAGTAERFSGGSE